jgi:uroporphyrinogen-III synthase
VIAPLFSPRSAALLSGSALQGVRAPLLVAALSPAVAEAWSGPAPAALEVADRPEAAALLAAMERLMTRRSSA